jgi:hypothetical protein
MAAPFFFFLNLICIQLETGANARNEMHMRSVTRLRAPERCYSRMNKKKRVVGTGERDRDMGRVGVWLSKVGDKLF